MPDFYHNCLRDSLFHVRLKSGPNVCSLPQILHHLGKNEIEAFSHLQKHQQHAWHAFLVQLAAIALNRQQKDEPCQTAETWLNMLLDLSGKREEPWCLIVEDLSQPAFFQPPVPEGNLKIFKNEFLFPDELDILITSKNHDLKSTRLAKPEIDHWLFALITLQTMQGFLGAGNYGIARMNGGFANRPGVSFNSSLNLGHRFQRDIKALLSFRPAIVSQLGFSDPSGKALLWLEPWDGQSSLGLNDCDPFFIEICRRIRFSPSRAPISAFMCSTKAPRINAKESCGNTGDPWTPVEREAGKALTMPQGGFSYERVQEILFEGKYKPGAAQQLLPDDPQVVFFLATAMTRGQGKTEGLHERIIKIPPKVRRSLGASTEKEKIGAMAKRRVGIVSDIQKKILKPALCALLQSGKDKLNFTDSRPRYWLDRLDDNVDRIFFEDLWQAIDLETGEADLSWLKTVCELAHDQLKQAFDSVPISSVRKYRATCAAERIFFGCKRKLYPELFHKKGEANDQPHE